MFHFNPPSSRINALKKSALFVYSVGIGLFLLVSGTTLSAQWAPSQDTRFPFSSESLDRIDIVIDQDSLDIILQDGNQLSDYEFPATFIYTYRKTDSQVVRVDTVDQIGFRLRGNTSRNSEKKSFKVSFNTFQAGRQYRGLDKMNINGEHNDPTMMRALLSWGLMRKIDLPAPSANPVELYINQEYKGLYINVEHIDDEFVQHRFGSDAGNLYKNLYPADLTYRGSNSEAYKFSPSWTDRRTYELKTNTEQDNYSDLATLISVLENTPDSNLPEELEAILNVDNTLRWMAIDIVTGNWDNYWYNKNNFYLYRNPSSNRFEFIPYDYDNTFGIDFIGPDWGRRSWENWGHPTESRPLTDRLLEVPEYRQRLDFYLRELVEGAFQPDSLFPEIDRFASLMLQAARDDVYRSYDWGFSPESFLLSLDQALGGHVAYGLKPYIQTRFEHTKTQNTETQILPVIRKKWSHVQSLQSDSLTFEIAVEWVDDDPKEINLEVNLGNYSEFIPLKKTLQRPAQLSATQKTVSFSDPQWAQLSLTIPWVGNELLYALHARSEDGGVKRDPRATEHYHSLAVQRPTQKLLINELMADNETTIQDPSGSYEDWVELLNPGVSSVNLSGYYLTDDLSNPGKWALPDTQLQAGGFLLIWTDNDDDEGSLHTNFALSKNGEELGIFYKDILDWTPVDTLRFPALSDDQSFGRSADFNQEFTFMAYPTPGSANSQGVSNEPVTEKHSSDLPSIMELLPNYPNPFNPTTKIQFRVTQSSWVELRIFNTQGQKVREWPVRYFGPGLHSETFHGEGLASGLYILQASILPQGSYGTGDRELQQRSMLLVR